MSGLEYAMRVMLPLNPSAIFQIQAQIEEEDRFLVDMNDGRHPFNYLIYIRTLGILCEMMEDEIKRDLILKDPFSYIFNF
mmetsp:Transcript_30829/g.28043  ORF Transcript_30829/g.28043 Transcript_30829/m.28043 type:complete len:80 (+) Transcript_30829:182-421(+)